MYQAKIVESTRNIINNNKQLWRRHQLRSPAPRVIVSNRLSEEDPHPPRVLSCSVSGYDDIEKECQKDSGARKPRTRRNHPTLDDSRDQRKSTKEKGFRDLGYHLRSRRNPQVSPNPRNCAMRHSRKPPNKPPPAGKPWKRSGGSLISGVEGNAAKTYERSSVSRFLLQGRSQN